MSPLSRQEQRWIREGLTAIEKLVGVLEMLPSPEESGDPEDGQIAQICNDLENISTHLETLVEWGVEP